MNLPNKLTILRALMVPVFVFFILYPAEQEMLFRLIALFLFCAASFTDYLDGHIARKRNLVTNLFCINLYDSFIKASGMVCDHSHFQRIYHFRFSPDCRGAKCGNSRILFRKAEDSQPDGDDYSPHFTASCLTFCQFAFYLSVFNFNYCFTY